MSQKQQPSTEAPVEGNINPDMPPEAETDDTPEVIDGAAGTGKAAKARKSTKKMSNTAYLKALEKLEAELVHLQSWVVSWPPTACMPSIGATGNCQSVR